MARRERPPRRPDVHVLRLIAGELQMADVRAQVALPFATEFENFGTFTPSETAEEALNPLLDQLISWTRALKTVTACRPGPFWAGTPDGAHPRLLPSMGRLPRRARQVGVDAATGSLARPASGGVVVRVWPRRRCGGVL